MISTAIFLSLISFALALPTGSPICRKDREFTSHHGGKPDTSAPFKATAVAGKDLTATISIKGKFAGLLLYVNKVNSQSNIGSFKTQKGFAYVPECDSGNESTLTHIDVSQKGDTSFVWTAPEAGSYVVNAIVAGSAVQWNEFSIKIDIAAAEKKPSAIINGVDAKTPAQGAKPLNNQAKAPKETKKADVKPSGQATKGEEKKQNASDQESKKSKCREKGKDTYPSGGPMDDPMDDPVLVNAGKFYFISPIVALFSLLLL